MYNLLPAVISAAIVIVSAVTANDSMALTSYQDQKLNTEHIQLVKRLERMQEVSIKTYTEKDQLSPQELKDVLYDAGFRGHNLREAWGIAMKESTGRPRAHNKNSNTGDNSYGLFQINMIGSLGPDRLEKYNLKSNEDLFNPLTNAKIAYQMSNGGENWSAWKGLTPRTKEWMSEFPK